MKKNSSDKFPEICDCYDDSSIAKLATQFERLVREVQRDARLCDKAVNVALALVVLARLNPKNEQFVREHSEDALQLVKERLANSKEVLEAIRESHNQTKQ